MRSIQNTNLKVTNFSSTFRVQSPFCSRTANKLLKSGFQADYSHLRKEKNKQRYFLYLSIMFIPFCIHWLQGWLFTFVLAVVHHSSLVSFRITRSWRVVRWLVVVSVARYQLSLFSKKPRLRLHLTFVRQSSNCLCTSTFYLMGFPFGSLKI